MSSCCSESTFDICAGDVRADERCKASPEPDADVVLGGFVMVIGELDVDVVLTGGLGVDVVMVGGLDVDAVMVGGLDVDVVMIGGLDVVSY